MLSTAQNIREQVSALTETIYSNLTNISTVSKTFIKKAEDGDSTVDADLVVSDLVHTITTDLQKHVKTKCAEDDLSVEYGEAITPYKTPQESADEKKEVELSEEDKIMNKVSIQDNEARQVVAELFDIYEQTMASFTQGMLDQKHQLEFFEANQLLQQSQKDENFLIKSSGKLLEASSNFPQTRFSKFDSGMLKVLKKNMNEARQDVEIKTDLIDKFLTDLQKSSQNTVNLLLNIKNQDKFLTRWTERVFNSRGAMNCLFPEQSNIDMIKGLDKQALLQMSINKISTLEAYPDSIWSFESCDSSKSSFDPQNQGSNQTITLNQVDEQIRSITFYKYDLSPMLSGLVFKDANGSFLHSIGKFEHIQKTLVIEQDEFIVGVKASYWNAKNHAYSLQDIQFLLAKENSE